MTNSDMLTQSDVPGQTSEESDFWGRAVAAGDINGDGFDDLSIAAPLEEILGVSMTGIVNVLFGSSTGMNTNDAVTITQESTGTGNTSEEGDAFGWQLAMGDYNGDGKADLAMAAPSEGLGAINEAGIVIVQYGDDFLNGQEWNQDSPGIESEAASEEGFGSGIGW